MFGFVCVPRFTLCVRVGGVWRSTAVLHHCSYTRISLPGSEMRPLHIPFGCYPLKHTSSSSPPHNRPSMQHHSRPDPSPIRPLSAFYDRDSRPRIFAVIVAIWLRDAMLWYRGSIPRWGKAFTLQVAQASSEVHSPSLPSPEYRN